MAPEKETRISFYYFDDRLAEIFMNNSTSGLIWDCDLSSSCFITLHCNGTQIVHFGGSFACVCMRVCSCLSLCMSAPVSLCPFCHPSSSRHGYLIYFGGNFVYVYDCVIVSLLLLLVIGFGRPLSRNFGCTHVCVSAGARVCMCVLQSLDIGIPLSH